MQFSLYTLHNLCISSREECRNVLVAIGLLVAVNENGIFMKNTQQKLLPHSLPALLNILVLYVLGLRNKPTRYKIISIKDSLEAVSSLSF